MLCGAHLYGLDPKLRCCYCCTYILAHAAAACLLHFSLFPYFPPLFCIFSTKTKLAKLKGLLRVQPNSRRNDEPQRHFISVRYHEGVDRLGLSLLWAPNIRATRIVGHPSLTLPSASSHPHPIPSSRTTKYVVCCCCLHIKSRSDLYSVPSNIRMLRAIPEISNSRKKIIRSYVTSAPSLMLGATIYRDICIACSLLCNTQDATKNRQGCRTSITQYMYMRSQIMGGFSIRCLRERLCSQLLSAYSTNAYYKTISLQQNTTRIIYRFNLISVTYL